MYKSIEIAGKLIDKDSLRFEGNEVIDAKFKDKTDLTDDQLRLLTQMHLISDLV